MSIVGLFLSRSNRQYKHARHQPEERESLERFSPSSWLVSNFEQIQPGFACHMAAHSVIFGDVIYDAVLYYSLSEQFSRLEISMETQQCS